LRGVSKKTDDSFAEFIRDQLQDLDEVTLRRMFGGYGIYAGSQFFAILLAGRLYFKTDSRSRVQYTERGMEALRATTVHSVGARRQPTKKSYRQGSQKP
jgi:TfoX/Sxy family transcriptional regulator of competence genes